MLHKGNMWDEVKRSEATSLRMAFRLTRQQTILLHLLMAEQIVPSKLIYETMDVRTEVRVAMHRLRKALQKHNISIESQHGFGYWLSDETKEMVRQKASLLSGEAV